MFVLEAYARGLEWLGMVILGALFVAAGLGVAGGMMLIALVLRAASLVLGLIPARR
jgi:hypothetical protein